MIFFTSDTHFNCDEIIKRECRPFKNCKQCDNYIIKTWNKQAKKTDTIYVVGDFVNCNRNDANSWKNALKYVKRIKAKVILIVGNNEERVIKNNFFGNFENFRNYCLQLGFEDVKKEEYTEFNNNQFYLNHFPKKYKQNYINLFGHVHRATGLWKPFGINVGVDLNYFKLYSFNDIEILLVVKKEYWDNDENNNVM